MNLVDDRGQDVADGGLAALVERLTQRRGECGTDPPDQLEQMREEPHHVVVVVVDCQPANRDAVARELLSPLGRKRALAEARGRVDEYEPSPTARAQNVEQPVAGDQRSGRNGRSVLRRRSRGRRSGARIPPDL